MMCLSSVPPARHKTAHRPARAFLIHKTDYTAFGRHCDNDVSNKLKWITEGERALGVSWSDIKAQGEALETRPDFGTGGDKTPATHGGWLVQTKTLLIARRWSIPLRNSGSDLAILHK
jgi:hypothetical protein